LRKVAIVGAVGAVTLLALGSIGVASAVSSTSPVTSADPSASPSPSASAEPYSSTSPAGCQITVVTDPQLSSGKVTARTEVHCPVAVQRLTVTTINLVDETNDKIVAYNYAAAGNTDQVSATATLTCKDATPTRYRVDVYATSKEDNISFGYLLTGRSRDCPTLNCGA
jgi:hypothetical protein